MRARCTPSPSLIRRPSTLRPSCAPMSALHHSPCRASHTEHVPHVIRSSSVSSRTVGSSVVTFSVVVPATVYPFRHARPSSARRVILRVEPAATAATASPCVAPGATNAEAPALSATAARISASRRSTTATRCEASTVTEIPGLVATARHPFGLGEKPRHLVDLRRRLEQDRELHGLEALGRFLAIAFIHVAADRPSTEGLCCSQCCA